MTRLAAPLLAAGALIFVWAIAWWWITYDDVIRYAYISPREAGICLVGDSDICRLARALCRGAHPIAIIAYRAPTFWIGVAALSSSLLGLSRKGGSQP
jgi:hypothetical protein